MRYSFLLLPSFDRTSLFTDCLDDQLASSSYLPIERACLLDVIVADSNGNPVTGLTQNDFRVFEDDKPQKIASFKEHTGAPIDTGRSAADAAECLYELHRSGERRFH